VLTENRNTTYRLGGPTKPPRLCRVRWWSLALRFRVRSGLKATIWRVFLRCLPLPSKRSGPLPDYPARLGSKLSLRGPYAKHAYLRVFGNSRIGHFVQFLVESYASDRRPVPTGNIIASLLCHPYSCPVNPYHICHCFDV